MTSDQINPISGRIAGVNLSSFLQMIEMEQKTCTVNVSIKKDRGQIFFYKGHIINADTRNLKQLDALYDILSWTNFIIEVEENKTRKQNKINLPLLHIIMEGARIADESRKTASRSHSSASSRDIPLRTTTSKDFCLEIGTRLLMDFRDIDMSVQSTLVGIEPEKYLLLKVPLSFEDLDQDQVNNGEVIIKSLYKGTIYAFRSRLMAIISKPSRLMFIQYPKIIEHHELRSHKRFKCSIAAQTQVNETEREGVIENISMGGCRCTIETFSSDKNLGSRILNEALPFRCRFPGSEKEVRFTGAVKNTLKKSDEVVVGIEFIYRDNSEETREIISNYIRLIQDSSERV